MRGEVLALRNGSVAFFGVVEGFFRGVAFRVGSLSAFCALRIRVLFASPSQFCVLVDDLTAFLYGVFSRDSVLYGLIRVTMGNYSVCLAIVFLRVLVRVDDYGHVIVAIFRVFGCFSTTYYHVATSYRGFVVPPGVDFF